MSDKSDEKFKQDYASHLKHLKLKGLWPKTIDAYSRVIRRIGVRFNYQIDSLSEPQLTDFFSQLLVSRHPAHQRLDERFSNRLGTASNDPAGHSHRALRSGLAGTSPGSTPA